jgi:putative nucleotidyltransferase with HDIG domain
MNWIDWMGSDAWRASLDAVPMVPAVAREVLEFATANELSPQRLAAVVSKDPVLATRVLQFANSAASASAVRITSINDAVVRMGTAPVRNVVTAVCVASILSEKGASLTRGRDVIDHGIGTGYIASLIAEAAGESKDEAFVCGLLHDIGKLLIQHLAARPRAGVKKPSDDELSSVMTERHPEFGGHLLHWWKLPETLHDAVRFHHEPDRATASGAVAVAYAANRLAHRYGFGCPVEEFDPLTDPVIMAVGITERTLERIDRDAPKWYDAARQLTS